MATNIEIVNAAVALIAKAVSCNIEQHFFSQTWIMGYRLKKAA
jgi:hypothetical protein